MSIHDRLCQKGMCPIRAEARASKIEAVLETFEKKKKKSKKSKSKRILKKVGLNILLNAALAPAGMWAVAWEDPSLEQFTLHGQENIVKNSWEKLQKIKKEKNPLGYQMQEDKHRRDVERFKTYVMAFSAANKPGYIPQKKYKYGIEWTDKELKQLRELHAQRKRARSWQKMIPKQDIFTAGIRQTKYARLKKRH